MSRLTEIIEIEIECSEEQLAAAIAQASQIDKCGIAQMLIPLAIRQVFAELPESSQVAIQVPHLGVQKTPLLEHKHG